MITRVRHGGTVRVTFELQAAFGAERAVVCGDFNGWSETADELAPTGDGRFTGTLVLEPGRRWHFRYLIDGHRWENDWAADDYAPNIYGGQDSVVDLSDPASIPTDDVASVTPPVEQQAAEIVDTVDVLSLPDLEPPTARPVPARGSRRVGRIRTRRDATGV